MFNALLLMLFRSLLRLETAFGKYQLLASIHFFSPIFTCARRREVALNYMRPKMLEITTPVFSYFISVPIRP